MKKKNIYTQSIRYNFKVNQKTFLGLKEKKKGSIDPVEFALR